MSANNQAACIIGHITVHDGAKWDQYCARVPATLAPFGASLLLRGRRLRVLTGQHSHTDTVVIRFPDAASVEGWYASTAYHALIPLRDAAADVTIVAFET
ncbi:MAG: hypothetical protein JWR21_3797 [Herminiimonas sp.]|nr:hypothetical protein [Herminiimonas sp.]MDB5852945.1 hypothetical protein [Herminiimonas sp.]